MKALIPVFIAALVVATSLQAARSGQSWADANYATDRQDVQALFDTPLRDTFVLHAPDGNYYLTGTSSADGEDFHNNDGVFLWKSSDLENWRPIGQVWSLEKQGSPWQKQFRPNPENPYAPPVRGVTAPEIHFVNDTFYIPYSMNGQGTGLLKSQSGKPEGPYQDLGQITPDGASPSIFVDDDNSLYWLHGEGFIAKMNDALTALAEEPVLITPKPNPTLVNKGQANSIPNYPFTVGMDGANITKIDDAYFLSVADTKGRLGNGCYDTFVARADNVKGPYSQRRLSIPHGGQTNLFLTKDKQIYSTFSGRDRKAVLRDRPAVLPMKWCPGTLYGFKGNDPVKYPRIDPKTSVERGPWAKLKPLVDTSIRDLQILDAPDGHYYLTGSMLGDESRGKLLTWRSKDLKNWEEIDTGIRLTDVPGIDEENAKKRLACKGGLAPFFMDCEIHWIDGTFWYTGAVYGDKKLNLPGGNFVFRSKSGKIEGPWEYHFRAKSQSNFFKNSDGKHYSINNTTLTPLKDDFSGITKETKDMTSASGVSMNRGDASAAHILKIGDKYISFHTHWDGMLHNRSDDGTYDWMYYVADKPEGPYVRNRKSLPIPHAGHSCRPFKGPDGSWYIPFFGNDFTGPWWCQPGLLELDVKMEDGLPVIDLAE